MGPIVPQGAWWYGGPWGVIGGLGGQGGRLGGGSFDCVGNVVQVLRSHSWRDSQLLECAAVSASGDRVSRGL